MNIPQYLFLILLAYCTFRIFFNIKILYITRDNVFYYKSLNKVLIPSCFLFACAFTLEHYNKFVFPEFFDLRTISIAIIIPIILCILIKIDIGWKSLQIAKVLWQSELINEDMYKHGRIITAATAYADKEKILKAEDLIKKSISHAPASNMNEIEAACNKALAHQELGFLYRAINKYNEAELEYNKSLAVLNSMNKSDKRLYEVFRDTYFRIAELNHAKGNYTVAKLNYENSLEQDENLGHNEPIEEALTKKLLLEVESKINER